MEKKTVCITSIKKNNNLAPLFFAIKNFMENLYTIIFYKFWIKIKEVQLLNIKKKKKNKIK